jgi:hypothetical protein
VKRHLKETEKRTFLKHMAENKNINKKLKNDNVSPKSIFSSPMSDLK